MALSLPLVQHKLFLSSYKRPKISETENKFQKSQLLSLLANNLQLQNGFHVL